MIPLLLQETATVPVTTLALVVGALMAVVRLAEKGLALAAEALKSRRGRGRSDTTKVIDPGDGPVKRREFAPVIKDFAGQLDRHEGEIEGVRRHYHDVLVPTMNGTTAALGDLRRDVAVLQERSKAAAVTDERMERALGELVREARETRRLRDETPPRGARTPGPPGGEVG